MTRPFQFSLRTVLIGMALLTIAFAVVAWSVRGLKPIYHLPIFSAADSDVVQMKVKTMANFDQHEAGADIPRDRIPDILKTLADGAVDLTPAKWVVLGIIECRIKSGLSVEIELFYIDGIEMAFRTDDRHYFHGVDARKMAVLLDWPASERDRPRPIR